MPYINTKTNVTISADQEAAIKSRLGQAAALIGKNERFLMVNFEDNCRLYFGGDREKPAAFIEIRLFGKASSTAYDNMTKTVAEIISEELKVPGDRIYVQYEEVDHWGWNGANF